MTASQPTPARRTPVLQALVALSTVAAVIVAFLAFERASERTVAGSAGATAVDFGPDAYSAVVTAADSVDAFVTSTVWTLASSQAQLLDNGEGIPIARIASPTTAHLVGLESDGAIIGLALVPPGLDATPGAIFVSPESTLLALIGLHPDVTAADPATHASRLAAVSNAPGFAELAGEIDGQPLDEWGQQNRVALQRLVDTAVRAAPSPGPSCADAAIVASDVFRCASSGVVENYSNRSVVFVDGGRPCGVATAVTQPLTEPGREALVAFVESGAPLLPGAVSTLVAAPSPAACGATSGPSPDPVDRRFSLWADDAVPYARLVGIDADVSSAVPQQSTLAALGALDDTAESPTAAQRIDTAVELLRDSRSFSSTASLPISAASTSGLETLRELLIGVFGP